MSSRSSTAQIKSVGSVSGVTCGIVVLDAAGVNGHLKIGPRAGPLDRVVGRGVARVALAADGERQIATRREAHEADPVGLAHATGRHATARRAPRVRRRQSHHCDGKANRPVDKDDTSAPHRRSHVRRASCQPHGLRDRPRACDARRREQRRSPSRSPCLPRASRPSAMDRSRFRSSRPPRGQSPAARVGCDRPSRRCAIFPKRNGQRFGRSQRTSH